MKLTKPVIWSLLMLVLVASLYRIIPGRQPGFAPQWAMALFAGACIKDRKWALIIPVLSLLISDSLYQILYIYKLSAIQGFYGGQWINYLLFASVTVFGFFIKTVNIRNVLTFSFLAPTYFFIISNFLTWAGVGEFVEYPKSFSGLMSCYGAGLPFYKYSLISTGIFSSILFGSYYLLSRKSAAMSPA
jgi:hypothetical protein